MLYVAVSQTQPYMPTSAIHVYTSCVPTWNIATYIHLDAVEQHACHTFIREHEVTIECQQYDKHHRRVVGDAIGYLTYKCV